MIIIMTFALSADQNLMIIIIILIYNIVCVLYVCVCV